MLDFTLKSGKRLELENNDNSLNEKLYKEDGIYIGKINLDIDTIADMLFTG